MQKMRYWHNSHRALIVSFILAILLSESCFSQTREGQRGHEFHGTVKSFPFILLSPQCPEGEYWTDTDGLIALLEVRARVEPRADSDRCNAVKTPGRIG
jgi:hypothetical protein